MAPDTSRLDITPITVVDLDENGSLLDQAGVPVPPEDVQAHLHSSVRIPHSTTDIFVFVHGWQTPKHRAIGSARLLFGRLATRLGTRVRPYFVVVRWPSRSGPTPAGYKAIRDRAHAMTTRGYAAHISAHLLGYLHSQRRPPRHGPARLANADGQYLHCIGHSFGCRFLCEAIGQAADPPRPQALGWPWRSAHPFGVDTFVGLQMAAPPSIFADQFASLVNGRGPLHGPIVLTHSTADRALSRWHRIMEGVAGIGAIGASAPPQHVTGIVLRPLHEPYSCDDFRTRIVNVDASWLYRRGRFLTPAGGHSDYHQNETAHLLSSLVGLAR